MNQIMEIQRPIDVPDSGLLCDLLWSDPDPKITGWADSDRGVSCVFGADKVVEFLEKNDLDLICRGHQVSNLHELPWQLQEIWFAVDPSGTILVGLHMDIEGGGRWVRVFRKTEVSDDILSPELWRRIRQRGCDVEC